MRSLREGRLRVGRPLVVAAVIGATLVAAMAALGSPTDVRVIASCPGVERWDVKTLTDTAAGSVHFSPIVNTTVAALRNDTPSSKPGFLTARMPDERTVYRVSAQLVKAEIVLAPGMKGDEDIHLVIAEPGQPTLTMIAELPKGGCIPESNSSKAAKMDKARAAFLAACGPLPHGHFKTLQGTATLTGVGFFDVKHGTPQVGRAPHDRELHPVLTFKSVDCAAG